MNNMNNREGKHSELTVTLGPFFKTAKFFATPRNLLSFPVNEWLIDCSLGLRLGLCAGQSSSSLENYVFIELAFCEEEHSHAEKCLA